MPFSDSVIQTKTSQPLQGVWLHDVVSPSSTLAQYLYGNKDRSEMLTVNGTVMEMLGRVQPIVEFGIQEDLSVDLSIVIPFDTDHDAIVDGFRTLIRSRATLCYRDNRERIVYGILTDFSITDEQFGSTITATVSANNYTEEI